MLKRPLALLLAFLLLLCGCRSPSSTELDAGLSAEQVILSVLNTLGLNPDSLERTDECLDETSLATYLTEYYGLEKDSWEDCAIYRAGGAEALEIAVFRMKEDASMENAADALNACIYAREGDFTGYSPEQAAIVHQSTAVWEGRYLALLIYEDAPAAQAAFYTALGSDTVPAEPSLPPEEPETPSPDAGPAEPLETPLVEEPSDTPEPAEPTESPDSEIEPVPSEEPSDPPVETSDSPVVSIDDTPIQVEEIPEDQITMVGPHGYDPSADGRWPFDPPGIDDMTLYNTSAIRDAWKSGDPSGLSTLDRAIYDGCVRVFEEVLTDGNMSDYDKEWALSRWLVANVAYDYDHYDHFAQLDPNSSNPYGPLVNGKGICLGFATTFQLFMDLCDIECITVVGAAFRSGEDHAWNMVKLKGNWYCVDVTWDNRGGTYFNVTSDYMAQTDHQWDYENVPEATATDKGK